MSVPTKIVEDVVIKFAGDSGDGMQLTGSQFTNNTALIGNDLSTFPDFPAEIRAPQGTVPGVSGYQLHFSSNRIYTPGDSCDVLVAMNAAALKVNLKSLKKGGTIIANTDGFDTTFFQRFQVYLLPAVQAVILLRGMLVAIYAQGKFYIGVYRIDAVHQLADDLCSGFEAFVAIVPGLQHAR